MKALFWITLAVAAAFAILLGLHVQIWIDDVYPMNIVFFGPRLTVFLALGLGMGLCALAAAILWRQGGRGGERAHLMQ